MDKDGGLNEFLTQRGYQSIRLNKSVVGQFEVEAIVNGHEMLMVIDTGASASVLDEKSAAKLGLVKQDCADQAIGAGGSVEVAMADVEQFDIQSVSMGSRSMAVLSLDHCNAALESKGARRVDGIIGGDVLGEKSAIIEYANRTLYLR